MKLHKQFILTLALAAMALGVTTSRASAADVYKGTFTLPVEAYWSSTLLHPGEYTISMDMSYGRNSLIHLRGENMQTMILTGSVNLEGTSERSRLTLEDINGVYVVRELKAGVLGKDFRFSVSKAARRQTDRASAGTPVNVPVVAAAADTNSTK
jgi:hypothetical protein